MLVAVSVAKLMLHVEPCPISKVHFCVGWVLTAMVAYGGSWERSATNATMVIKAELQKKNQSWVAAEWEGPVSTKLANIDGKFEGSGGDPDSWTKSARNITIKVKASCRKKDGTWKDSEINVPNWGAALCNNDGCLELE